MKKSVLFHNLTVLIFSQIDKKRLVIFWRIWRDCSNKINAKFCCKSNSFNFNKPLPIESSLSTIENSEVLTFEKHERKCFMPKTREPIARANDQTENSHYMYCIRFLLIAAPISNIWYGKLKRSCGMALSSPHLWHQSKVKSDRSCAVLVSKVEQNDWIQCRFCCRTLKKWHFHTGEREGRPQKNPWGYGLSKTPSMKERNDGHLSAWT